MTENKTFSVTLSNIGLKKDAMEILNKNLIFLVKQKLDKGNTCDKTTLGHSLSYILDFYYQSFLKEWLEKNDYGKKRK